MVCGPPTQDPLRSFLFRANPPGLGFDKEVNTKTGKWFRSVTSTDADHDQIRRLPSKFENASDKAGFTLVSFSQKSNI